MNGLALLSYALVGIVLYILIELTFKEQTCEKLLQANLDAFSPNDATIERNIIWWLSEMRINSHLLGVNAIILLAFIFIATSLL